jgi:polysaccharide export outer membrane protein
MNARFNWLWLLCFAVVLTSSSGCRLIYPGQEINGPRPHIPADAPRELAKTMMPDYIIEAPDIVTIEAISLIPKSPYRLRPLDVTTIYSSGLPEEVAIQGEYVLQPNGTIQLGHSFGLIPAVGKTVEELQSIILAKLEGEFREPQVWVTLSQIGAQQQISGEHLVAPDGKVNLGTYGRVRIVGMTIEEADEAIREHLSRFLEDPEIALDVFGYNSKVFYVITQGAGLGDQVTIIPSKGNETVLDAIGQIQGLQSNSSTRMWIARPGHNSHGGDQLLPVDWLAVTQRGDTATNYQILPGDRLYVSEDKLVALDTALGKLFSPIERILGVTLLASSASERVAFWGSRLGGGGFGF